MTRKAKVERKTKETDITVSLVLDSIKESRIETGVPFFDHMLSTMARHGRMCIDLQCKGDITIDDHHTVEDVGICLGDAMRKALGDGRGIRRFGHAIVPMDDALAMASVDFSGRPYFNYDGEVLRGYIAKYSEELTIEFFRALTSKSGMNLHLEVMHGNNRHHMHEALFKAAAVALYTSMQIDESIKESIPSEKGTIS